MDAHWVTLSWSNKGIDMHLQDLRDALHQQPFTPFRLFISGGVTFDVRHPELCVPGIRSAFIGFPAPAQSEPAFDRYTIVDLRHIIRLEPLEQAATQATEG